MSDTQNKQKSKRLFTILRICVATAAIIFVIAICYTKREAMKTTFSALSPAIFLLALALFIFANIIISLRWCTLLRAQQIKIPFTATLKVHFLGMFYNNIMLSSVGGDMLRIWYIAQHTNKRLEAGLSVFVDRVIGLVSLTLMAAGFYILFPVDIGQPADNDAPVRSEASAGVIDMLIQHKILILSVISTIIALVVLLFLLRRTRAIIIKLANSVITHRHRTRDAIAIYCKKPLTISFAMLLTFCAQSTVVTGFWLIGRSMSIDAAAKYYFVFFPLGWVLGALPISIGGVGVLEFGLAGMFAILPEVTLEQGLALAFCQRFVFLLGSIPGIGIHILGAHLPKHKKDFTVDSSEDLQ